MAYYAKMVRTGFVSNFAALCGAVVSDSHGKNRGDIFRILFRYEIDSRSMHFNEVVGHRKFLIETMPPGKLFLELFKIRFKKTSAMKLSSEA